MKYITLTTDFGLRDWFVGTLKGVIASIAPKTTVVDLAHELPPGDILAGAFALAAACSYFPRGSIHVAVVDPGVGSSRRALAVRTERFFFVGPDNGVLSLALKREKVRALYSLENKEYFLHPLSGTFHGRDIFCSVAAHLSRGLSMQKLGPPLRDYLRPDLAEPKMGSGGLEGEIIYMDRFGNAVTNLDSTLEPTVGWGSCVVCAKKRLVCPVRSFYQSVPGGSLVAIRGSTGYLEIAVNGGSAQVQHKLKLGTKVIAQKRSKTMQTS